MRAVEARIRGGPPIPGQGTWLLVLVEFQGRGVHAVALAGRRGPVVEDVPQMAAAVLAVHFGPGHEEAAVRLGVDAVVRERLPEARPAGAGIELRFRV